MTNEMIKRINEEIAYAKRHFDNNGYDECHARTMQRIYGMLDMLTIVTSKKYIITENGLEEV